MDHPRARHVELILKQVNALPTLPAVATRLLSLTADKQTDIQDVVDLITTDPALTAKILSLCRSADMGIRTPIMTVDQAVVMLGFNAIRNAVLSMKVFDTFDASLSESQTSERLCRPDFWRHSVAVAVAAENIAKAHPHLADLNAADAFVCGLLHDIGKLALDMLLPRSYDRVIELTELNRGNIAEFERRIVGIDHHTAGKRLAEQWHLPHKLQDCIWLHGADYSTLPNLEHRRLIGLISLADMMARKLHLGFSGNFQFKDEIASLADQLGLHVKVVHEIEKTLIEDVKKRSGILGLSQAPSRELFYESIQHANEELGRLNNALERRGRVSVEQARILSAITDFHTKAVPGRSVQEVLEAVIQSANEVLGHGFFVMLWQPQNECRDRQWMIRQYMGENRSNAFFEGTSGGGSGGTSGGGWQLIDPPPYTPDLSQLDPDGPAAMNLSSIIPWVADYLVQSPDVRKIQMLPLSCGWGTAAILLHDRARLPAWAQLSALTHTWGGAIAGAAQHEGARRLGEQLAESNLALAEAQDQLLQAEAMSRLGEMASGAAHEMNNPLAVICGRSQLLVRSLADDSSSLKHAKTIVEQSHRLSDLITALKLCTEVALPDRVPTDIGALLEQTLKNVREKLGELADEAEMEVEMAEPLPTVLLDPLQIEQALGELIHNALEASPDAATRIQAQLSEDASRLQIKVSDKGPGMDEYTLAHAMDPFFSAKPAGRQVGMGLTRAQQLAVAHGGEVGLCSVLDHGTEVTLSLPLDLPPNLTDTP